jgi:hypothetical protein
MANPFTDCRAQRNVLGQWCVLSEVWAIPCTDEESAKALCEIIHLAHEDGVVELRAQFVALLTGEVKADG